MDNFYKNKKVLVTGGTGFVGTNFVEALLQRGAKIRVPIHERTLKVGKGKIEEMPADLRNLDDCLNVMEDIDIVCHCAGPVTNAAISAPIDHIVANLVLCSRVLQGAWKKNVDRAVIFSSHTGYPAYEHPVKEEEYWIEDPHPFYFGYGWMRRYLEIIGRFTTSKSDTKVAIVRPSAPYGIWDNFDLETCHVIPALIRKAVEHQDPYEVWGTGEEVRDFIYIKDFVNGSLALLEKNPNADPTNIAYGKSVKIKEVVDIILKAANYEDAKVIYNSSKPTAIPKRMIDNSKARKSLGFNPQYTLEEGLTETVKWYSKMRKEGYIR